MPLLRSPHAGCIAEFLQADKAQPVWILEEKTGKFRALTMTGREIKLPAARFLPWLGPAYDTAHSREDIAALLTSHQQQRTALEAQIDPRELWELAQGEVERADIGWLAELIWSDAGPDHLAATGHRILEYKTHFHFKPPLFEIRPREIVEKRLLEEQKQRQRELILQTGKNFFRELWESHTHNTPPPPPPQEETAHTLKKVLLAALSDTAGSPELSLWNSLRKGLPDLVELPLLLAQTWKILPPHYNHFLLQEGYEWEATWAVPYKTELEELASTTAAQMQPACAIPFISIDAPTTQDIDDAFFITPAASSAISDVAASPERPDTCCLHLALACPCHNWPFDSPLDMAVRERASSLYLPEGTSHMLPEYYGLEHYSLTQKKLRPALVLECILSAQGELKKCSPRVESVRIAENITYATAEEKISKGPKSPAPPDGPDNPADTCFTLAQQLTQSLQQARIAQGAVIIDRPEPQLLLAEQEGALHVILETPPAYPQAQLLVSELMILANAAMGQWAHSNDLPVLYRTQDITLPGGSAGVWEQAQDINSIMRCMAPAILESTPKPHATLAVPAYCPVTSPLRRYVDFINMAQIVSLLTRGTPVWTRQELDARLPAITARVEAATRIQRFRQRYWKLLYFQQQKNTWFSAVVVDDAQLVTLALPQEQLYLRAPRSMLADKIYPGQRFEVRTGKINPLLNEIRLIEAREE